MGRRLETEGRTLSNLKGGTPKRTDRWTDRPTGRRTGRRTDRRTGRRTGRWTGRRTSRRTKRTDEQINERSHGLTDGRSATDELRRKDWRTIERIDGGTKDPARTGLKLSSLLMAAERKKDAGQFVRSTTGRSRSGRRSDRMESVLERRSVCQGCLAAPFNARCCRRYDVRPPNTAGFLYFIHPTTHLRNAPFQLPAFPMHQSDYPPSQCAHPTAPPVRPSDRPANMPWQLAAGTSCRTSYSSTSTDGAPQRAGWRASDPACGTSGLKVSTPTR